MKSVTKPQAADAPGRTPQPPAPGDWPSQFALMAGVLVGLAGDRAKFRSTGDLEAVTATNLLIPRQHLRLHALLSKLTDGAKELQKKLVESSMAMRSDVLEALCGGRSRRKKDDVPVLVREQHIQALRVDMGDELSDTHALDILGNDIARGRLAQREHSLNRPMQILQSPELKSLAELVAGCHGGQALVLGDLAETIRPTRRHLMRLLQGSVCAVPSALRRGLVGDQMALLRISMVMRAESGIIERLCEKDPEFLGHFIIMQPGAAGGLYTTAANGTRNPIPESTWFERFDGAVARTIAARRNGNQLVGWFHDAGAAREFNDQRQDFVKELEAGEFASMAFLELANSIGWLICQLVPSASHDQMICNLAVKSSRILWRRHSALLSGIRAGHQRTAEQRHEEKILQRVAQCTKATRREVFRGFDDQRYAIHQPAIDRLLTSGKLLTYDNRLVLAPAAAS